MRAYAGDWALFTDWCQVTGEREMPADPDAVLSFLTDCPAAPATLRRRVAGIDYHHLAAGHPRPGETPVVRAALSRPALKEEDVQGPSEGAAAALRGLPSHGWTRGMFGRRDRCLLVLSQLARVPYKHLATVTAGHIIVTGGTATISAKAGTWTLLPGDDALLCGSCAIVRWLRVLDLVVTRPGKRHLSEALKKAKAVTGRSPHLCRSRRQIDQATTFVPLLPPIDQWGHLPFPVQRLTPHSLSRRTRDLLDGDLGAHRDLPVNTDDERGAPPQATPPVVARTVFARRLRRHRATAGGARRKEVDRPVVMPSCGTGPVACPVPLSTATSAARNPPATDVLVCLGWRHPSSPEERKVMAVRWYSTVMDCRDLRAQGNRWADVLGWKKAYESDDEVVLVPQHATLELIRSTPWEQVSPGLVFVRVADGKTVKNRLHLDLAPHTTDDRDTEMQRLLDLGATRADVGQGPEISWTVLADPEGNEFCVLSARDS
ncbi:VOC family protein [Nakamurella sp. GG22]